MILSNMKELKSIVADTYVKELLGVGLYEDLSLYPQLQKECDVLLDIALKYEKSIYSKNKDYILLKDELVEQILSIHNICVGIDKYRVSYILFNEDEELEEDLI